jgi:CRP/FNR family cyclic AMP-dependent transcriptional regulator
MACNSDVLWRVPLFALLDAEEAAVLAAQVELKQFAARQRSYRAGDRAQRAYVMVSGKVRVATVDEDHQEVVVDEPTGMDMLAVLGHQFRVSQQLVPIRTTRNPNEVIEQEATLGDRVSDAVARLGGSWGFIIACLVMLMVYTYVNHVLGRSAWDPYPFILLNLFLSMLAALQAPIIMMSQNRQDAKDRTRGELDYEVNRRAESEIQGLAPRLNLLGDKIADIEDLLRQKPQ